MDLKITLICNQGVSTSIVAEKMLEEANKQGINLEIEAINDSEIDKTLDKSDIILIGPQIRYIKNKVQESTNTIVEVIDMMDYGRMDGKAILEKAIKRIEENEKN